MGTLREDYTLVLDAGTFGIICRKDYRKELDRIIFLARLFSERGLHPGDRIYLLRSQKLKKLQGTDPVLEHTELKKLKRKEEQKNVMPSENVKSGSIAILATNRQVEHFLTEGIDDFEDIPLEEAAWTWRT